MGVAAPRCERPPSILALGSTQVANRGGSPFTGVHHLRGGQRAGVAWPIRRRWWGGFPRNTLGRRLWLWRRGFLTRSDVLYDLTPRTWRQYLTDLERFVLTKQINGGWATALDNKLVFHWMLGAFDEYRPTIHGMVMGGQFHPVDSFTPVATAGTPDRDGSSTASSARSVNDPGERAAELLRDEGRLVLKWKQGGGGNNVHLCAYADGEYRIDGEALSREAFEQHVEELEEYLVCEFVEQADFSARLYPETPNTFRVLTIYDRQRREPFVAIAIYRIGSEQSRPVDNFSRGGLSAEIDLETGELGKAVQLPESSRLRRHERHPDSGAAIAGTEIPGWADIRDAVLEMAAAFPQLPYIGWDLIPTDGQSGFAVIEANSYPGLRSLQVHRPLLADDRVEQFYDSHNVFLWDR